MNTDVIIPMRVSDTPHTDLVENEVLAEYRYCELSHNAMAEVARDMERKNATLRGENARLREALQAIADPSANLSRGAYARAALERGPC